MIVEWYCCHGSSYKYARNNVQVSSLCWYLNRLMTKPTKWHVRPAKTQISLGIRPVWSESSLCAQCIAKDPSFLHADSEDWSDWADAQADLSLRWGHSHFVGFVMRQLKYTCMKVQEETEIWSKSQINFVMHLAGVKGKGGLETKSTCAHVLLFCPGNMN